MSEIYLKDPRSSLKRHDVHHKGPRSTWRFEVHLKGSEVHFDVRSHLEGLELQMWPVV